MRRWASMHRQHQRNSYGKQAPVSRHPQNSPEWWARSLPAAMPAGCLPCHTQQHRLELQAGIRLVSATTPAMPLPHSSRQSSSSRSARAVQAAPTARSTAYHKPVQISVYGEHCLQDELSQVGSYLWEWGPLVGTKAQLLAQRRCGMSDQQHLAPHWRLRLCRQASRLSASAPQFKHI